MDGGWLVRTRWRRRGAWLWPAFFALTIVDAFIGHALPPAGETQALVAAALIALVLNVLAVLLGSRPIGALARRRRPELPSVVARDYGGTVAIVGVTALLLTAGIVHRPTVLAHQRAMRDAIARAQAFIGDRAPADFRRNLRYVSTFVIEPGSMYRSCVPSAADSRRTYCVIVKTQLPLAQSVSFAGYESNAQFGAGAGS